MDADRPELRLSDAERQDALDALGEHMRSGRLDIDEFSDRTARVTTARTRRDLVPLFTDLPEPRPGVLREHPPSADRGRAPARTPRAWLTSRAVPITAILALVLFFTIARGFWLVFLIPAAVALLIGTLNGGQGRRFDGE